MRPEPIASLCVALLGFSLVLAACGDDSGGGGGAANTPTPAFTPGTNTPTRGGCATPGQTFSCTCGPTEGGTQMCLENGELGTCSCDVPNTDTRRTCDPSVPLRLTCKCDDDRPGLELCGDDSILQPCNCDLPEFTGGDEGDGGADDSGDLDAGSA